MNFVDNLLFQMEESGLYIKGSIDPTIIDKFQRFKCHTERKGAKNIFVRLHGFETGASFGNWKDKSTWQTWWAKKLKDFTEEERSKRREVLQQSRRQQELITAHAKWRAELLWCHNALTEDCFNHPYVRRKRIIPYGAKQLRSYLIIPIYDQFKKLVSLQYIHPNGFKQIKKNTNPKGGYLVLGSDFSEPIRICEGYATGCSIYEAIGGVVVIAFNAYSLEAVAKEFRLLYPDSSIHICCDLDNAGMTEGIKAAKAIGGKIQAPNNLLFGNDWNDLFIGRGIEMVERQLLTFQKDFKMLKDNLDDLLQQIYDHNAQVDSGEFVPTIDKEDYPDVSKGKTGTRVLNTFGNLKYLLNRLGASVRWNSMRWIREVVLPGHRIFIDDEENSALRIVTNLAVIHGMPYSKIDDHLTTLAQENNYHPIVSAIESKGWDGVGRLETFLAAVKTSNDYLSHKLIKRWMISAIAAACSPKGIAPQGVLVLQGKQKIGKTTWFKNLDPIYCGAVLEGAILDPTNKDNVFMLATHWINEIGELDATFRRVDIARQKSYITNQFDVLRLPYARKLSRIPRRSVCGASVNEDRFLMDSTGNRRWWVIPVESIDRDHGLDMQQVWAEVWELWRGGEDISLSQEEFDLLMDNNTEHESVDPFEEKVLSTFDWQTNWRDFNTVQLTATEVMHNIGYDKPTKQDCMRMAGILYKLTGKKPNRKMNGRFYLLPRFATRVVSLQ